jgi:hypothetical protein
MCSVIITSFFLFYGYSWRKMTLNGHVMGTCRKFDMYVCLELILQVIICILKGWELGKKLIWSKVIVCLFTFFFWPLYCVRFTPLVSSNSSYSDVWDHNTPFFDKKIYRGLTDINKHLKRLHKSTSSRNDHTRRPTCLRRWRKHKHWQYINKKLCLNALFVLLGTCCYCAKIW